MLSNEELVAASEGSIFNEMNGTKIKREISGIGIDSASDEYNPEATDKTVNDLLDMINASKKAAVEQSESERKKEEEEKTNREKAIREQAQQVIKEQLAEEEAVERKAYSKELKEFNKLEEEQEENKKIFSRGFKRKKTDLTEDTKKTSKKTQKNETLLEESCPELKQKKSKPQKIQEDVQEKRKTDGKPLEQFNKDEKTEHVSEPAIQEKKKSFKKSNKAPLFRLPTFSTKPTKENEILENSQEVDWKFIATHDKLTGLMNQSALEEACIKVNEKQCAIIFFDINNLKYCNDTLGHSAGNKLIIGTAEKLKELFAENAYRTGGDEFIVLLEGKNLEKKIIPKLESFQARMIELTKESKEKITYAVSVGYAVGDGNKTVKELRDEADANMYKNKKAYKALHPEIDARRDETTSPKIKKTVKKAHDEMLTKEQQEIKYVVRENHRAPTEIQMNKILTEIQRNAPEILAILVAAADFDDLFIIQNVETFLELAISMSNCIDYSYLYVVMEGGPIYYGTDDYYTKVTHIFEPIAEKLRYGILTQNDIKKIKGINIFKRIHVE